LTGSATFYDVLGISANADEDEIKRAYFRGIKAHPPEKDAEGYQRIREAYETLSDRTARKEYDALLEGGDEVRELLDKANDHMANERFEDARSCLKTVIALASEADAAWNLYGICCLHLERYEEALKVFTALMNRAPDVALYAAHAGHSELFLAEESVRDSEKAKHYRLARAHFEKALALDPGNHHHHLGLARVYSEECRFDEAIAAVWGAIHADESVDLGDLEALFELCWLHIYKHDLTGVGKIADEIEKITPADPEVRRYVAHRFARLSGMLLEVKAFDAAKSAADAALKFDPGDGDLVGLKDYINRVILASNAFDRLVHDSEVIPPIKLLCVVLVTDLTGESMDDRDGQVDRALEAIGGYYGHDVVMSVNRLRTHYSQLYSLNHRLFEAIDHAAKGHPPSTYSGGSTGSGCILLLIQAVTVGGFLGATPELARYLLSLGPFR